MPKLNLGFKKQESQTEHKVVKNELDFSKDKKLEQLTEVARFRFLTFYFGVMLLTAVMATFYGVQAFTDSPDCSSNVQDSDQSATHFFYVAFTCGFAINLGAFIYYAFLSPSVRK